ncbi:hypothetical protein BH10BAC5_BH10BAC5_16030 [soil metagenome]
MIPNSAYLHILINHVPVIGTGIVLFVIIYGIIRRSDEIKKLAMVLMILTSALTVVVFYSGEKSGRVVTGIAGVNEDMIDAHGEFADWSYKASTVVGIASIVLLIVYRKKHLPFYIVIIFFLLVAGLNGMMAWTSHLGGKINHLEIMGESPLVKPK